MTAQDVRNLHEAESADAYTYDCAEGDCSGHPDGTECPTTPVDICGYCYARANEPDYLAAWLVWPCETIRALDSETAAAPTEPESRGT